MKKEKNTIIYILPLILVTALILRLVLAYLYPPYPETMKDWAQRIVETGFAGFYGPEVQWPYPPLYLYILWILGLIIKVFNITDPGLKELVIELPPIICDIAASILLWKTASKRLDDKEALLITALYAFNPAAIHNSSMWGQTDSVFTLAAALMCVFFCEEKYLQAFIAFGAGLMLKQQTLTFAPIVIAALAAAVVPAGGFKRISSPEKSSTVSLHRLPVLIAQGLAVIAGMILISLPFGLIDMLRQYLSVQSGMPYVSVGAYNFWMMINRGWCSLDTTFIGVSCGIWGKLAIIAITLLSFFLAFLYGKDTKKYPLLGASLILPVFCFATGMHERYMLSGLLMLALAWVYDPKPAYMIFYTVFTLLQFFNTVFVYHFALIGAGSLPQAAIEKALSFGDFAATVSFVLYVLLKGIGKNKDMKHEQ